MAAKNGEKNTPIQKRIIAKYTRITHPAGRQARIFNPDIYGVS